MKVLLNGDVYIVTWHHTQWSIFPQTEIDGTKTRGETLCFIGIPSSIAGGWKKQVSSGLTRCSVNDQFNKETGRKISLTRALEKTNLTKSERAIFWQTYFDRNKEQEQELVSV